MSAVVMQSDIEAQVEKAYNFSVDKFRLYGPDNMITDLYGCFRSDNQECIGGAVKKNYNPHTLEDIKALAVAAMEGFDGAQMKCLWNNGHILIIEPTKEYRRSVFGTKDDIFPRAFVEAKYGGLSSLNGSLGLYRDVCKNLMLARSMGRVIKKNIRHSNNLGNHLKELIADFRDLLGNWNGVVAEIEQMQNVQLNMADFLRQVYPMPNDPTPRVVKTHEKRIEEIIRRIECERNLMSRFNSNIARATAWEAFNAVQGYEQHSRGMHGSPTYDDRVLRALDAPVVSKAYSLSLQLAS